MSRTHFYVLANRPEWRRPTIPPGASSAPARVKNGPARARLVLRTCRERCGGWGDRRGAAAADRAPRDRDNSTRWLAFRRGWQAKGLAPARPTSVSLVRDQPQDRFLHQQQLSQPNRVQTAARPLAGHPRPPPSRYPQRRDQI